MSFYPDFHYRLYLRLTKNLYQFLKMYLRSNFHKMMTYTSINQIKIAIFAPPPEKSVFYLICCCKSKKIALIFLQLCGKITNFALLKKLRPTSACPTFSWKDTGQIVVDLLQDLQFPCINTMTKYRNSMFRSGRVQSTMFN